MNERSGGARRPDRAGLVIALMLAAIAGVIAWDTSQIAATQTYASVGPKAFPYTVSAALFLFSIATAFAAFRQAPQLEKDDPQPIFWIVGGLVVQLLLISHAGFSIATGLMFAATAKAFGRGNFVLTIPVGIVLSLFLWFVFSKGLSLSLPAGPLERLF